MEAGKQFSIGDRVMISDSYHWAKGCAGTIKEPPAAVKSLDEEWNGYQKTVSSIKGKFTAYWVEFDEPQIDADGDGPYAAAEIHSEFLI